ncbi:MAG: 4-alpha-glucanotransferase, partial [Chlamydiae bacterium]|nr:4-alpha-glucanotransferase [Chlamydiota bacterium]
MTKRGAGVNIPIFSLRTKKSLGCGEFLDLIPFIDWAKQAGLKLIQILPINDTSITGTEKDGYPYSILSAYALHPIYLHVQALGAEFEEELAPIVRELNLPKLDYQKTYLAKREFFKMLFILRGEKDLSTKAFAHFFEKNQEHLKPYAAFCVLRDKYGTSNFKKWKDHAVYSELAVEDICEKEGVDFYYFLQYHLDKQLHTVRSHARKQKILLKGDFPIGVHPHSVEAWRFSEYFRWNKSMGAPPDFYNHLGQNWGFPSYNWEEIRAEGFYWLKSRLAWMQQYFDAIRIDHVLGYFRLWEIPEDEVRGLMGNFYPAEG